jgi:hypothetical protein
MTDEERDRVRKAYRRGGFGLALAALLWTAALLLTEPPEDGTANWLIPVGAAALSVLCFSLYRKSKES